MTFLLKLWRRHFLFIEALIVFITSIAFIIWFYCLDGAASVNAILIDNRSAVYGTMASIFGSLLGFVITATSIVLGFSVSDKLTVLRSSTEYPKLWKTFSSTIWALGVTALVSLVCLLLDKDKHPFPVLTLILVFFTLISLVRIARTIWALEHIIILVTKK
jgi:hypothetical protein